MIRTEEKCSYVKLSANKSNIKQIIVRLELFTRLNVLMEHILDILEFQNCILLSHHFKFKSE